MPISDATLVLGVLNADCSAFAELYDRRAGLVRAICFDMTGKLDLASDLTQEVFLRAFRQLGSLNDPDRFKPWLLGIARKVCREWRRGKLREQENLVRYADNLGTHAPSTAEESQDRLHRLREAIRTLPEKQRWALHAFYTQALDFDETCQALGLSRSGMYHVLSTARKRLKRALTRQEALP